MPIYTVGEFRSNMKEAFDAVINGEQVTIIRGTDIFILQKGKVEVVGTPGENTPSLIKYDDSKLFTHDVVKDSKKSEATPRTSAQVYSEIVGFEIDQFNQDPDYIAEMNAKKQALWDEFHRLKGEGL